MSNSLTSIDPSFISKDANAFNNIKNKLQDDSKANEGKSFKELLKEKIQSDGTVNQTKLDKREKKLYDS